ncbi:MAG: hypothetical protein MJ072_00965, partial [Clostridia bacterium]|nr:hypothetical protein [Clostridia bacterium]
MKKTVRKMIVFALAIVAVFAFAACTPAHVHDYKQIKEDEYLATAATCTDDATYYLVCDCGELSTETWTATGTATGHNYDRKVKEEKFLKTAASCTADAVYYYSCACEHAWNAGEVTTPATCTTDAVYYYSCVCGEVGEETWTAEDTATGHHHTVQSETNLASPATCSHGAMYYLACTCGDVSTTETWEKADTKLAHLFTEQVKDAAHIAEAANFDHGTKYYFDCAREGCNTV